MGTKRKRKLFTGNTPIGGKPIKSRRVARIVTSRFHDLTRSLKDAEDAVNRAPSEERLTLQKRVRDIQAELTAIGGRHRYQEASIISTQHHQTSKWIIQNIKLLQPRYNNTVPKLKLLEVGAINTQLLKCPWLDVKAIDIHSQHPSIEEVDFFDLEPQPIYDFVVASMVVNCVPEPVKRGEMLARFCAMLKNPLCSTSSDVGAPHRGVLFLVLPVRFVSSCSCGKCNISHKGGRRLGTAVADERNSRTLVSNAVVIADGSNIKIGSDLNGNAVFNSFLLLLDVVGLTEVAPRRVTPKLIFFTLSPKINSREFSIGVSSAPNWTDFIVPQKKKEILRKTSDFEDRFGKKPFCICSLKLKRFGGSKNLDCSSETNTCSTCKNIPCNKTSIENLSSWCIREEEVL